jgi:hypothetical protein
MLTFSLFLGELSLAIGCKGFAVLICNFIPLWSRSEVIVLLESSVRMPHTLVVVGILQLFSSFGQP